MDISIGARGTQGTYGLPGAEMSSGARKADSEWKESLSVGISRQGMGVEPSVGVEVESDLRRDDDIGLLFDQGYKFPAPELIKS